MSAGHRFYDEITAGQPEPILVPLHAQFSELIDCCRKANPGRNPSYCPVADLSNNLFYVRPPGGMTVPAGVEDRIHELISDINPRLLNVPESTLKETGTLLLVAGTRQKALAIRELLTSDSYRIRFLCTDRSAAETILKEVQG